MEESCGKWIMRKPAYDSWKDNRRFRCVVVRSIDWDMVVSPYNNNHRFMDKKYFGKTHNEVMKSRFDSYLIHQNLLGSSQAARHQTLTLASRWFKSSLPSHNLGVWCNGSMSGSNPVGKSSNLLAPAIVYKSSYAIPFIGELNIQ